MQIEEVTAIYDGSFVSVVGGLFYFIIFNRFIVFYNSIDSTSGNSCFIILLIYIVFGSMLITT